MSRAAVVAVRAELEHARLKYCFEIEGVGTIIFHM